MTRTIVLRWLGVLDWRAKHYKRQLAALFAHRSAQQDGFGSARFSVLRLGHDSNHAATNQITNNPSPANLPKSGSYFSLKIVLAFHTTLEMIQQDATENVRALGYLLLDD